MLVARSVTVVTWCAVLGFAGCATTRSSLVSSADALEHNADALARDAGDDTARSDYRPT